MTPHLCSGCVDKYWNDYAKAVPKRSLINGYKLVAKGNENSTAADE